MQASPLSTLRSCLSEGRQGTLLEGKRRIIVRVFDESPLGFRAATIQTTGLSESAETVLSFGGIEIAVRIVKRRQEGRRLVLDLTRIGN